MIVSERRIKNNIDIKFKICEVKTLENNGLLKKMYGNLKMSWLTVIIFAIAAGIYTGMIMLVPALNETSFQDIGINFEWWVIFAVIIIVNCRKNTEAMLKCFVFFLISQPVIYAVEILFGPLVFSQALIFYKATWLPMTFAVLPGAFIAYYCKRQDTIGAVVLGLGNTIQFIMGITYIAKCAGDFPHHLLSIIICFVSIPVMSFGIQESRKNRLISMLFPVLASAVLVVLAALTGRLHV